MTRTPTLSGLALLACCGCFLLGLGAGCSSDQEPGESVSRREALEKEFEASMSGVTLEGYFNVAGDEGAKLRKEKYVIEKVSKLGGDYWTFHARIQYGSRDVTLPVPVKILWAGDTPVITLTDAEIPGLGTFTARMLFYRGRYAGTWWHGESGGSQFGRIIRPGE